MDQITCQLAVDFNPAKARFPLMGFQKIDGVRAAHVTGKLTGRSLDPFKNTAVNAKFDSEIYTGFDGELTIDGRLTGEEICNTTTGLVNTSKLKKGELALPDNVVWNLFDWLHPDVVHLPYLHRYESLIVRTSGIAIPHVNLLPFAWINNLVEAHAWIRKCADEEYEGAIFRDPNAMHKSGRATEALNDYWRWKPVSDKDAIVLSVEEAMQNNNEAKTNSLGRTERSGHKENKVGNGMIGCLICRDVVSGKTIRVGPGALKHADRVRMFGDQTLIVGHPIKYTSLDVGVVDQPRQARYKCHRPMADLVKEAA
jgi:DNA ligase-1